MSLWAWVGFSPQECGTEGLAFPGVLYTPKTCEVSPARPARSRAKGDSSDPPLGNQAHVSGEIPQPDLWGPSLSSASGDLGEGSPGIALSHTLLPA